METMPALTVIERARTASSLDLSGIARGEGSVAAGCRRRPHPPLLSLVLAIRSAGSGSPASCAQISRRWTSPRARAKSPPPAATSARTCSASRSRYCRAIAILSRSSGEIRWSTSSAASSMSICTQLDRAAEALALRRVVVRDRRRRVAADIAGLVGREDHRHGSFDPALADLLAVDVERDCSALAQAPSVVGELHPHLMRSCRNRRLALDVGALHAEEVVAVLRLAALRVEAPAGERAALGDDRSLGALRLGTSISAVTAWDLFLTLIVGVLAQPAHAAEEELRLAFDERGPSGQVGVEALDPPVVEREHVVLARLVEPELLELGRACPAAPRRGRAPGSSRCSCRRAPRRRPGTAEARRHHPRSRVAGDRGPALVVDAAVAEHLEVLRRAALGRTGDRRTRSACSRPRSAAARRRGPTSARAGRRRRAPSARRRSRGGTGERTSPLAPGFRSASARSCRSACRPSVRRPASSTGTACPARAPSRLRSGCTPPESRTRRSSTP